MPAGGSTNPLRRVELERHKWDTHARASENRLPNSSRRPQPPRPASATRSASGIHGRAKPLQPVATPADGSSRGGPHGPAACLASDSSYRSASDSGISAGAPDELTRSQAELYSALFGGRPRMLASPVSSAASSPAAAWEAGYDLSQDSGDQPCSPPSHGHPSDGHTAGGGHSCTDTGGGPAPSQDTDGGPALSPAHAKLVERAVLRALRGAALQRQQAVDEARARAEAGREAIVAAAVLAATKQVRRYSSSNRAFAPSHLLCESV